MKEDGKEIRPLRRRMEAIQYFFECHRCQIHNIISEIIGNLNHLPEKLQLILDTMLESIQKIKSGINVVVSAMELLCCLSAIAFPVVGLPLKVVLLVAYFLKIILTIINIENSLETEAKTDDAFHYSLAGLVEKLESMIVSIDAVDVEEHVDESSLQNLILNIDIHIGIEEMGNIKCRIFSLLSGGRDDLVTTLQLLKLYARISSSRCLLLCRYWICLTVKDYSPVFVTAIKKGIEQERIKNQSFFSSIFTVPSLKHIGVLAVFDPNEEKELALYLKDILGLSFQDLKQQLHDQVFMIRPVKNASVQLGRPFPSFRFVRAMGINVTNVRIRFRLLAIENEFNLFYIKSPDVGEYVYMNDSGYCKYARMMDAQDNAQWRVIAVEGKTVGETITSTLFVFCNKRWPEKIIYMERSYFAHAKGFKSGPESKSNEDCVFTLTTPDQSLISSSVPCPPKLGYSVIYRRETKDPAMPAIMWINEENSSTLFLKTIQFFLEKRQVDVNRDVKKIENFIFRDENNSLHYPLEKIADSLLFLEEDIFSNKTVHGVLEILSINFQLFQKDIQFQSIYLQLLRICGLILSCIWKAQDINIFVVNKLNPDDICRSQIEKELRALKRFTFYLHEIECARNILERDITDMKEEGRNFMELKVLASLKEKAKCDPYQMVTSVKVSILQLTILWQMYAVAKLPGHSDKVANTLRNIILMQKDDDLRFFKEIIDIHLTSDNSVDLTLIKEYLSCISCRSQNIQSKSIGF